MDAQTAALVLGGAGIAGTAVTAIGQTALANRRHKDQLEHDRAVADRSGLRDVLDAGAQTMRRAMWSSEEIVAAFRARDLAAIDAAGARALELTREGALISGRLALRLGRGHPVSQAYDRMVDEFAAMQKDLAARFPGGWRRHLFPAHRAIGRDLEEIAARHDPTFVAARRDFIDAAREIVGVSLLDETSHSRRQLTTSPQ